MSRIVLGRIPFLVAVAAGALALGPAAEAENRLRPVDKLADDQLVLVSTASARAFDHIQSARDHIATRQWVDARQELAKARTMLLDLREASPATQVQDAIAGVLETIQNPTHEAAMEDVDPVFEAIGQTNDPEAYDAVKRYVSRARYQLYHDDVDAASRELIAASARVPYATIDAPIHATWDLVNRAMIHLYDQDLEAADRALARALNDARAVVRLASGAHDDMLGDVAAPPDPLDEEIPGATEPEPAAETPAPAEEVESAPEFEQGAAAAEETPAVGAGPAEAMESAADEAAGAAESAGEEMESMAEEAAGAAESAGEAMESAAEEAAEAATPSVGAGPAEAMESAADEAEETAEDAMEAAEEAAGEMAPSDEEGGETTP